MDTLRRLYLYTVLAVTLGLLSLGLTEVIRLLLDGLAGAVGSRPLAGGGPAREEMSRAIALLVVSAPVWATHAWLVGRSVRGVADRAADERASASRAAYFFVVLVLGLAAAAIAAASELQAIIQPGAGSERIEGGAIPVLIVFGAIWLSHVGWRRRDLRRAAARMTGDLVTRLYGYGTLFVAAIVASAATAATLVILGRFAIGAETGAGVGGLRTELAEPVAALVVAGVVWVVHWLLTRELLRAPEPMGPAQRAARARPAYLLGIVLVSALVVLGSLSGAIVELLLELLPRRPTVGDDGRLIEDVGGLVLTALPFAVAWWWHERRAATEAALFVGPAGRAAVVRAGRLIVAAVGLLGLSIGLAIGLATLIDLIATFSDDGVIARSLLRGPGAVAVSLALVGLALWAPTWTRVVRESTAEPLEVARATARRAYLAVVAGVAVITAMLVGAVLIYQLVRSLLGAGDLDDPSGPLSILLVAVVVLAYHLIVLRSDLRIVREAQADPAEPAGAAIESIEIIGPQNADWGEINARLRQALPSGYELRVDSGRSD